MCSTHLKIFLILLLQSREAELVRQIISWWVMMALMHQYWHGHGQSVGGCGHLARHSDRALSRGTLAGRLLVGMVGSTRAICHGLLER